MSGLFLLVVLVALITILTAVVVVAGRSSQKQTTGSAPSTPTTSTQNFPGAVTPQGPTQNVPGAATPPSPAGWQVGPLISSDQQPALGYVTPRVTVVGQTLYEAAENQDGHTQLRSIDLATGRVKWTNAIAASTPQANWSSEIDESGGVAISLER